MALLTEALAKIKAEDLNLQDALAIVKEAVEEAIEKQEQTIASYAKPKEPSVVETPEAEVAAEVNLPQKPIPRKSVQRAQGPQSEKNAALGVGTKAFLSGQHQGKRVFEKRAAKANETDVTPDGGPKKRRPTRKGT